MAAGTIVKRMLAGQSLYTKNALYCSHSLPKKLVYCAVDVRRWPLQLKKRMKRKTRRAIKKSLH